MDDIPTGREDSFTNFLYHLRSLPVLEFSTSQERNDYIRSQFAILHHASTIEEQYEARHNIYLIIIPMFPSLISKYGLSFVPKEELIAESFFVLDRCIENFDLNYRSDYTNTYVRFSTFFAESLRQSLKSLRGVDLFLPFHVPFYAREFMASARKTQILLYMSRGVMPTSDEVYKVLFSKTVYPDHFPTKETFLLLWKWFITEDFKSINQSHRVAVNAETLETIEYDLTAVIPDPDADVIEAASYQYARSRFYEILKNSALTSWELEVLYLRFGFYDKVHTLSETAKAMKEKGWTGGVSNERMRQLEYKAIMKLKRVPIRWALLDLDESVDI